VVYAVNETYESPEDDSSSASSSLGNMDPMILAGTSDRNIILRNGANNNLCLGVQGAKYVNHKKVWLYACDTSNPQKWKVTGTGDIRIDNK
jgi:hypothetical protein